MGASLLLRLYTAPVSLWNLLFLCKCACHIRQYIYAWAALRGTPTPPSLSCFSDTYTHLYRLSPRWELSWRLHFYRYAPYVYFRPLKRLQTLVCSKLCLGLAHFVTTNILSRGSKIFPTTMHVSLIENPCAAFFVPLRLAGARGFTTWPWF